MHQVDLLSFSSYQSSLVSSFVAMSSYNHLSSLLTSYPPSTRSASTSTPNPTNTDKAILTVMCTCALLLLFTPFLALTFVLFALSSALLSELAEHQISRLVRPFL